MVGAAQAAVIVFEARCSTSCDGAGDLAESQVREIVLGGDLAESQVREIVLGGDLEESPFREIVLGGDLEESPFREIVLGGDLEESQVREIVLTGRRPPRHCLAGAGDFLLGGWVGKARGDGGLLHAYAARSYFGERNAQSPQIQQQASARAIQSRCRRRSYQGEARPQA